MIKRLERLTNTVNKYMAYLRPTSQNGSWSKSTTQCIYAGQCTITILVIKKLNVDRKSDTKVISRQCNRMLQYSIYICSSFTRISAVIAFGKKEQNTQAFRTLPKHVKLLLSLLLRTAINSSTVTPFV
jgi:hypothetical protein